MVMILSFVISDYMELTDDLIKGLMARHQSLEETCNSLNQTINANQKSVSKEKIQQNVLFQQNFQLIYDLEIAFFHLMSYASWLMWYEPILRCLFYSWESQSLIRLLITLCSYQLDESGVIIQQQPSQLSEELLVSLKCLPVGLHGC